MLGALPRGVRPSEGVASLRGGSPCDLHVVTRRRCVSTLFACSLAAGLAGADDHRPAREADTVLYVWASDQARVAPDFLAVVDFDEDSATTAGHQDRPDAAAGQRRQRGAPLPSLGRQEDPRLRRPPERAQGAERHLLLRRLRHAQPALPVLDRARWSRASPTTSCRSPTAGSSVTQMGSASGGAPGRVAEFDRSLRHVANHFGGFTRASRVADGAPARRLQPPRHLARGPTST